ncbi:sugar transferase [Hyunsoonleella pacifica]|uniref:Sugar transferase n=1 Tax=Hyunsoonleella pacifica TaxID=1080224 RepID=A0A4Q9FQP5_9FLAO|nr:sugar transferase [Hyunsoonleella pacifica]TBN17654.1 sugar transferase [Hyunsoonleella pacifica]GGD10106.1 sugar transferase [Hyunsoonleella pacifica]
MYRLFFKRLLDLFLATLGLLLILPIFLTLIISLAILNKGNPFFVQKRPGKNEKTFSIMKFKTMNDDRDKNGNLLPDEKRLTTIGKVIRKTSLDELPQLINIIKGDMSFIGPRPLLIRYLPYYSETEKKRHDIRPGITGLAQISGRNLLNWNDRLKKDVEYVENLSMGLDVKIFIQTIQKVITSKDVVVNPNSVIQDLDAIRSKH